MNPYLQTANSLSNSPFVVVVIINILAAKKHVKDSMVAGGGVAGAYTLSYGGLIATIMQCMVSSLML